MPGGVRCTATASFEIQVLIYKTGTRLNPFSKIIKVGFGFMFRPTLFRCQIWVRKAEQPATDKLDIQHRKAHILLLFSPTVQRAGSELKKVKMVFPAFGT